VFASRLDESYSDEVREAIGPLTAAKVGANATFRFAAPFIATIASGLDVGISTIGKAIAVGEIVGLSAPLLARLTNHLSRRTAICGGLLAIAASATVCATSRGAVQFGLGLALLSMSKIVFDLGIIAWLTDRVPYALLGRPMGLMETAWAAGLFIGVVAMGLVTGATSWRWGYASAIVAVVVLASLLRHWLPARERPIRPLPSTHDDRQRRRPRLGAGWWVVVGSMGLTAAAQSMFVTFGKWLGDDFGVTDTELAVLVFGLGAVELLAASSTVRFTDRWGKQRSTMFGALAMIPAALVLATANGSMVIGVLALAVFIGTFEFAIVSTLSLASSLIPTQPTVGIGLNVGASTLGRAVMAPIATTAFSRYGMWAPATISAGCAALTATCQIRYGTVRGRAVLRPAH